MNINLKLNGVVEKIIDNMISLGIASNKTEAIRLALLDYDKKIKELEEEYLVYKKMQEVDKNIKNKKIKTYKTKDLIKQYPEFKSLI